MSYSFSVQANTKEEAKAAVAAEFEKVVAGQPIHAKDKNAVLANANAVIDLLGEKPEGQIVSVSCNGYVGWHDDEILTSASVTCGAGYAIPRA